MEETKTTAESNKVAERKTSKLQTLKQVNGTLTKLDELEKAGFKEIVTKEDIEFLKKVQGKLRKAVLGEL